jgi:hypothetical protein
MNLRFGRKLLGQIYYLQALNKSFNQRQHINRNLSGYYGQLSKILRYHKVI